MAARARDVDAGFVAASTLDAQAQRPAATGTPGGQRAFELQDLSAGYADAAVVEHVSLKVAPGEIHCLLGPNGTGKTTLFRTALGLLPRLGGRVLVDGRDIDGLSERELACFVAYVPQAAEVPFAYRVRDVVVMGRLAHMGLFASPGDVDYAVADRSLRELGLEPLTDRLYTELSGGERQMVLLARAFAQEPEYILMDEPTAALDLGNQVRVLSHVRALTKRGIGILMTTHAPDHLDMCDATGTLLLRDGSYLQGSADELLRAEVLERAYGTEVMVLNITHEGRSIRLCRPVIES